MEQQNREGEYAQGSDNLEEEEFAQGFENIEEEYEDGLAHFLNANFVGASHILYNLYRKTLYHFGKVHQSTFKIQIILAQVYQAQGRNEEAYDLLNLLYTNQMGTFGPNREETMTTWNSMAVVLCQLGKKEEALEIFNKVYEKRISLLGPTHKDTLITKNYISSVLAWKGEDVLPVLYDIYHEQMRSYPERPSTFATGWSIAHQLIKKGKDSEALKFLKAMHDIQKTKEVLHRGALHTLDMMANILQRQLRINEALGFYNYLAIEYTKLFGDSHAKTLEAQKNQASMLIFQQQYHKGMVILNKVYKTQQQVLGQKHMETAMTLQRIAATYNLMGQHSIALFFYKKVHEIEKENLPELAENMTTYECIGSVLKTMGNYEEALDVFREIYEILENKGGNNSERLLRVEGLIAATLFKKGDYNAAIKHYSKIFDIQQQTLGDDHRDTLATQSSIAVIYVKKEEYEKALELFTIILEIQMACIGSNSMDAHSTRMNIAQIYLQQNNFTEAKRQYDETYQRMRLRFASDQPSLFDVRARMAYVRSLLYEDDEALAIYQEILPQMEEYWGKEHPDVATVQQNIQRLTEKPTLPDFETNSQSK